MKVYIVLHELMEGAEILGVFRNEKDAEVMVEETESASYCIRLLENEVIE